MVHMGLLWLKYRWQVGCAMGGAVLVVFLLVLMLLRPSDAGISFLGDAGAARPAAAGGPSGMILPRSCVPLVSVVDKALPAGTGLRTVTAAQAAWSAAVITQYKNDLLVAVNCARQRQGYAALTLDPALSQAAGDAWLQLIHHPSWSLMQLPGTYTLRGVLSLDFATVAPGGAQMQRASVDQPAAATCTVGGFDTITLSSGMDARAIGIAIFPPQATWDSASAVVLVK